MIGGMKIDQWRQCNIASPSVTAAAYGPGASNGIALTVKVLTGANITITGPRYQSSFTPGAITARAATAPATLIPEYTGSLIYGACNRNDTATSWTPYTGATFSQNVADTTNSAAYGTFTGPGATPTWTHVGGAAGNTANFTTLLLSCPPAIADGDLIAIFATGYCADGAGSISSAGFTTQIQGAGGMSATHPFWVGTRIAAGEPAGFYTVTFTTSAWAAGALQVLRSSTGISAVANTGVYTDALGYQSALPAAALAIASAADATLYGYGGQTATLTGTLTANLDSTDLLDAAGSGNTSGTCASMGWAVNDASPGMGHADGTGDVDVDSIGVALDVTPNPGGATIAAVPVTTGASNAAPKVSSGVVAVEIPANGTLAEDPSSPAPVTTSSATTVSTAQFTPPMGSLLIAQVATAGTDVRALVTDTLGDLTWVELVRYANGSSGYAGVWAAVVVCG
jgi:hypothetical protein